MDKFKIIDKQIYAKIDASSYREELTQKLKEITDKIVPIYEQVENEKQQLELNISLLERMNNDKIEIENKIRSFDESVSPEALVDATSEEVITEIIK